MSGRKKETIFVAEAATAQSGARPAAAAAPVIVVFVCENSARTGRMPTSGKRFRPETPNFGWPFPVQEVVVPCAGRLQPEHLLKAFEGGADAVAVVCCEEGNCHHHEGNKRCRRRIEVVSSLLAEIGLGKDRLMLFHLPGSAVQDMALGAGAAAPASVDATLGQKVAAVRDRFVAGVAALAPTPLRTTGLSEDVPYQLEDKDDGDE
jgi:F420-non-reducing hydrogenase iron-sulfur subunit